MATFPPTPGFIKSLDPANPIGTDFVYGGDDWIQFIQQVLDNQFPTSEDGSANGWDIALTVKASEVNALLGITGVIEDRLDALETGAITSGAAMVFYADTALLDWTILDVLDEHTVRLTKGSVLTGVEGGTQGGTEDFSTVFNITATDPEAGHTHLVSGSTGGNGNTSSRGNDNNGSSELHSHSVSITSQAGSAHSHDINLTAKWAACILCQKD